MNATTTKTIAALLKETRLPLRELAEREGVVPLTVENWTRFGCKGVRLESIARGDRVFTTEEAYLRFLTAMTARRQEEPVTA